MDAKEIIHLFGGVRPMARSLQHASHTTVQGWAERNLIPAKQQRVVLELARQRGVAIEPIDLIA